MRFSCKMEVSRGARVNPALFLINFLLHLSLAYGQYTIPSVTFEILKPKGVRASIPDAPSISLFVFNGNINRAIGNKDVGTVSGEILSPTNGRWVFEDKNVELKPGDAINYYVFVSVNGSGYIKDGLTYVVTNTATEPTAASGSCTQSVTKVRGMKSVCSGQMFDETFDSFREDIWQIEHRLPTDHPEFPFVSYQRLPNSDTVKLEGGYLKIQPKLQQLLPGFNNDSIFEGTLNLYDGCTETAESCYMTAQGANILPPIVSGRVSSRGFVFKYGVVDVRAKLPKGDWLYPEIMLEPFLQKYGKNNYASGVIKIASARGNEELYEAFSNREQYGNKALYGGVFMSRQCYNKFLNPTKLSNTKWSDDFHTYSVRWEPSRITFSVDGVAIEGATIQPTGGRSLGDEFKEDSCPAAPRALWSVGDKMAPFDTEFYLTIGLAAGGITEFKDGLYTTGGRPKPWKNQSSKAKLHFWQDLDAWHRTWDSNSLLIVDRVTVTAL